MGVRPPKKLATMVLYLALESTRLFSGRQSIKARLRGTVPDENVKFLEGGQGQLGGTQSPRGGVQQEVHHHHEILFIQAKRLQGTSFILELI